jgi:hypothetical protein
LDFESVEPTFQVKTGFKGFEYEPVKRQIMFDKQIYRTFNLKARVDDSEFQDFLSW